ncbi:MAG: flavodoxin family protein [Syntrophobacteraceae bacterium]
MVKIAAIYGSPRRNGNTAVLLREVVKGAREEGAVIEEVVLRDHQIGPCMEIYGCIEDGRCAIEDDFQRVRDLILRSDGLMLASPVFFYSVSAHTKAFMDRFQSLWVKKYWIDRVPFGKGPIKRKGLFLSVGATKGAKLFEGILLTIKYFFDVLDMELAKPLLFRGLDFEGDAQRHPEYLEEAYQAGREFARELQTWKER